MVKSVPWVLWVFVINYIKIIITMFILFFLLSCTVDSTQRINSKKNMGQKSKAKVTFEGSIYNGIYSDNN